VKVGLLILVTVVTDLLMRSLELMMRLRGRSMRVSTGQSFVLYVLVKMCCC
jgi:hypothetical protein